MFNNCGICVCSILFLILFVSNNARSQMTTYRPPAVPLVVHNPFLSIWSCADKLTDDVTRHWTKRPHSLNSIIRIDGKCYRLMGVEPQGVPALPQLSVQVLPTRTIYNYEGASVHVTLTFFTPALPTDIEVLSRPLTYLVWDVRSLDQKVHTISVLISASSELTVDAPGQKVEWSRPAATGLTALRIGSQDQLYVQRAGDDSRIDWGYACLAAAEDHSCGAVGPQKQLLESFISSGMLPPSDDTSEPRRVKNNLPAMALALDFGQVDDHSTSRRAMIAYDDVYTVDFFGQKLRGFWRQKPGMDGIQLLIQGENQYDSLLARCIEFDNGLMSDLTKTGGSNYAYLCAMAYRQSLGGCGIAADSNGQPMLFTKENTSNGNMATVDVIFPMDPILLFLSPSLAKASIAPVMVYAASPRWKWPNAPHDLGEYPIAFGRDGGGEAMPVEESGNMLILADAICQEDGNTKFVDQWWKKFSQWAKYLEQYGLDPEEQLCTDDFKGRLAHNANLSVKAIIALAAYGDMARMHGDGAVADRYMNMARADASHWIKADREQDHFKLAFDKPGTWGQNYNMVWDRILGLKVFPPEVVKQQIAFYKTKLQPFGLPLDSRDHLTKTDWSLWTASMADNQSDFEALTSPIIGYLNTTTAREPFADSYMTDNPLKGGFHARPVIGGVFIRMLTDQEIWKKWAAMDHEMPGGWATLPTPLIVTEMAATSRKAPVIWAYTTVDPGENWFKASFDDSKWKRAPGGFGQGSPGSHPRTPWKTNDIWLRREANLHSVDQGSFKIMVYHDDDVEIYLNGVLAATASGYNTSYQLLEISDAARAVLKAGGNQIAVHCHQTAGGQFIDVGIVSVTGGLPR